jgi:tRNA-splicing ligase RtcB
MPVRQIIQGVVPVKVYTDDLDSMARKQLVNLARLPFIHHHVAAMPDVHCGIGATIGSVIPTRGAIIPSAVGVDIGCGMMAYQLDIKAEDLPDSLQRLRSDIESRVPHGRTDRGGRGDRGAWHHTPQGQLDWWAEHGIQHVHPGIVERHPDLMKGHVNTHRHLGSLGTGNHFIEVCLDEAGSVWVMLHSGSRGIGNRVGRYFIELAKKDMERHCISLPDKDLAYLEEGSRHFDDYVAAVGWAQDFAAANRAFMMRQVLSAIQSSIKSVTVTKLAVECHHNYVARESHFGADVWITRKGALRAQEGELGIIPGSMGRQSYIVRGKGDRDALCSCAHGAGRRMSRTQARRAFTADDLAEQTMGIECRKDSGVVDEIPSAYKDIDEVMANQSDLVEIVHTLRQVVNVKG